MPWSRYAMAERGNAIPSVSLPAPVKAYRSSQRIVTGRPATIADSDARRETVRARSVAESDVQRAARSARAASTNSETTATAPTAQASLRRGARVGRVGGGTYR